MLIFKNRRQREKGQLTTAFKMNCNQFSSWKWPLHGHFTSQETEAQGKTVTCPRSEPRREAIDYYPLVLKHCVGNVQFPTLSPTPRKSDAAWCPGICISNKCSRWVAYRVPKLYLKKPVGIQTIVPQISTSVACSHYKTSLRLTFIMCERSNNTARLIGPSETWHRGSTRELFAAIEGPGL